MSSLAGRFLTTRPPGKYKKGLTEVRNLARDQAEFFFFFLKIDFGPREKRAIAEAEVLDSINWINGTAFT